MSARLLCVFFFLLLSGCATVQYRPAAITDPSEGAVIVRVLPNSTSASQFFARWDSITFSRISSNPGEREKRFTVASRTNGTSRTTIYAGSLPAGIYKFVSFDANQCGAICVNSKIDIGEKFSRFEVKSGRLTDLGVLLQSDSPVKGGDVVLSHGNQSDRSETAELVQELFPGFSSLLASPSLSWLPESVSPNMANLSGYAKMYSFGFVSPKEAADGSFIYGSINGVVYRWLPGQQPVAHDVGVRASIETVLIASSGAWLAGGELGTLRQSDDSGRSWRSIRGNLPLGVLVDLHQWRDKIIATLWRGKSIEVYAASFGANDWALLKSYKMELSILWDIPGLRPQSFLIGDQLFTTVPGRKIAYLNLDSKESETYLLPGSIQMFSVSDDGVLRCRCAATIAVNPYESHDFGKTWKISEVSRFMLMPTFRDKNHGVAFRGGMFSSSKMAYTEDGGRTWIETTETPVYFSHIFYSRDAKSVYAASPYGIFWVSRNDGRTWEPLSH